MVTSNEIQIDDMENLTKKEFFYKGICPACKTKFVTVIPEEKSKFKEDICCPNPKCSNINRIIPKNILSEVKEGL